MIEEIMRHIRNYFYTSTRREGTITIKDGSIDLPFIEDGNYFLIEGSVLNDGVYQAPEEGLENETFSGCVTLLAPPKAFIQVVDEIETFQAKYKNSSPYQSESFGGYSYTRATNSSGNAVGWQDVFKERLDSWRKI